MSASIATRTPEGRPFHCPICGLVDQIEPSVPADDAPCPGCGHLLWPEPTPEAPRPDLEEFLAYADLRDFEDWLIDEYGHVLPRNEIDGIIAHMGEALFQNRWNPARRSRFFARHRLRIQRRFARRSAAYRRPGFLSLALSLFSPPTAVASTDPLYDPWLDG
jgi:hypothetical protein